MSEAVSADRWAVAQAAEQTYWDGLLRRDREFGRVLLEKSSVVNRVVDRPHEGCLKTSQPRSESRCRSESLCFLLDGRERLRGSV